MQLHSYLHHFVLLSGEGEMDLRWLVQLFEVDSITIRYESGCPQAYRYETCENCMKDV